MKRIVLSTSSSSLDDYKVNHNIKPIRLHIHIENVEFIDGKNINRERLINLMNKVTNSGIKTSPATEIEIKTLFEELCAQGFDEVLIVTLSSQLSESFNIISNIAADFQGDMKIVVFDTQELNACEAIFALEAEYLLSQGVNMSQICIQLAELRDTHHTYFALDDIGQLIRNKKISSTSGFIANLFNIKPILEITKEGKIVALSKVRSFDKALDFLINELQDTVRIDSDFVYVLDTGDKEITAKFVEIVKEKLGMSDVLVLPASAISIANHGTAAVGLCVFKGRVPSVLKTIELDW